MTPPAGLAPPSSDTLVASLLQMQNRDGGWGYSQHASWTETTSLAILALHAWRTSEGQCRRAGNWLMNLVRADGGVAPNRAVQHSTWVTALALLVREVTGLGPSEGSLLNWLLSTRNVDSEWWYRFRNFVRGVSAPGTTHAWSWYPGTAAWVFPTAASLAALKYPTSRPAETQGRIRLGEEYLRIRVCRDGGWNHGSSRALGYDADSYPETTGAALVGLRGASAAWITRGVERAQAYWSSCPSSYALSWLELGLLAHGINPDPPSTPPDLRNPMEVALALIAMAARRGVPVLWARG